MRSRGILVIIVLAMVVVYFLFFAKAGKKSYIEATVDANERLRTELTRTNLATLERAVDLFISTEGRTPADLKEILRARLLSGDASDGWGRALRYERTSETEYRLLSAGKDGLFETADDLILEQ
ncbi:MAG: hypothetical protein AB1715_11715 [Acidobacteriota bacterium]